MSEPSHQIAELRLAGIMKNGPAVAEKLQVLAKDGPSYVLIGKALLYLDEEDEEQVLAILDEVTEVPEEVSGWYSYVKGKALVELGALDEAIEVFDARLQVAPQDRESRVGKARALFRLQCIEDAEELLAGVLDEVPDHHEALFGMGALRLATGSFHEAVDYLEKAQETDPLDRGPYRAMAQLYRMIENPEGGVDFLENALRNPLLAAPELLIDLAELYAAAGYDDRLPSLLDAVVESMDLDPINIVELGRYWYGLEDVSGLTGLAGLAVLETEAVGQSVRHLLLGLIAHLEDDEPRALDHFMESNVLWGEHWLAYERIAWCALLHDSNESKMAARHALQRCVALNPSEPEVLITQASLSICEGAEVEHSRSVLTAISNHKGIRKVSRDRALFAQKEF